jgi:hypothetical protein
MREHLPVGVGAFLTVALGAVGALADVTQVYMQIAPWALWTVATLGVVAVYVAGALAARAGAQRARRSVLDSHQSERRLALTRQELAAMEQAIADRTIEYSQLGEQLRDASEMLQLSEEQTAALRREVERAVAGTKRA